MFSKMFKIEDGQNMDFEDQNISDNVDFESYIDAVKENQITWKFFIRLMDDLANNMNRQKLLISILLKEFKNYMDLLKTKDFQNMESMIQDNSGIKKSMLQKSKSNEFGIQKSTIQDARIKESMIQNSKFDEFEFQNSMIQKSTIQDARIKESIIDKSIFDEFVIQDESLIQEDEKFRNDENQDDFSYIQNLPADYSSIGNNSEEAKNIGFGLGIQEESVFGESIIQDDDQDNINDAIETEIKSEPNNEEHIDPIQAQWAIIWKKMQFIQGKLTIYLPPKIFGICA